MNVVPIPKLETTRPLHAVLICLAITVLAGTLLLLSAPKPTAPVDGAIEWHEESWLRAVVQLLCLNYDASTVYGDAIKNYLFGIGAGLVVMVLGIAIAVGSVAGGDEGTMGEAAASVYDPKNSGPEQSPPKAHVAPLVAAQVLAGLFVLWSFASS